MNYRKKDQARYKLERTGKPLVYIAKLKAAPMPLYFVYIVLIIKDNTEYVNKEKAHTSRF